MPLPQTPQTAAAVQPDPDAPPPAGPPPDQAVAGPPGPALGLVDPRSALFILLSLFIFVAIAGNYLWIWITGQILELNTTDPGTLLAWSGITGVTVAIGRPAVMMYLGFFNAFLTTEAQSDSVRLRQGRVVAMLAFTGIVIVYLLVGSLVAAAGALLFANLQLEYILWSGFAAGALFVALGARTLLLMRFKIATRPWLPRLLAGRGVHAGFFLYGLGFGALLIGCAFPVLLPLMALASGIGQAGVTILTFLIYAAPVAAVNVLVTMLSIRFRDQITRVPSDKVLVRGVSAVLSIVLGVSLAIFFQVLMGTMAPME